MTPEEASRSQHPVEQLIHERRRLKGTRPGALGEIFGNANHIKYGKFAGKFDISTGYSNIYPKTSNAYLTKTNIFMK